MTLSLALVFVVGLLIAAVAAYLIGHLGGERRAYRRVEAWTLAIEADARANPTPAHTVELPGYQAIVRRYALEFGGK